MTKDEMRIAIAEAYGLKVTTQGMVDNPYNPNIKGFQPAYKVCPNYPEDLNAMHEAEKKLTPAQQRTYLRELYHVAVEIAAEDAGISTDVLCNEDEMFIVSSATAAQRAEAMCRTLWPERWK